MLYDSIKILHIISATFVLTSMAHSYHLWRTIKKQANVNAASYIQAHTLFVIFPFALVQLATGFTMVSLQQKSFTRFWIEGSLVSFLIAIVSWLGFIYFLLLSQQVTLPLQNKHWQFKYYRRTQTVMLLICALGLLSMIFFMANKAALTQ